MRMNQAASKTCVRVIAIHGGKGLEAKLRQLGLLPGDMARVLRQAPFGGPLLIEIEGRSIAIGRGIAAKIEVEEMPGSCE